MENLRPNLEFPALGQRIIRTVVGIFLCYLVYYFRAGYGTVFFAVLAVLQCIQPYMKSSFDTAKQRFVGTFIGAGWGFVILFVTHELLDFHIIENLLGYFLIAVFSGVVLYTSVVLRHREVAGFSAVVFLSIVTTPIEGVMTIAGLLTGRVLDTLIGVVIAIAVNAFHFPRDRNTNILFVSGIDDVMMTTPELKISPFSVVELNHLLSHGMKFTISTWRTPASIMKLTEGVELNLPVIAMSGAALYDTETHEYVETCGIPREQGNLVMDFFDEKKVNYFSNVVIDDTLLIYYKKISNEAEKGLYDDMKISPHRNYVNRDLPEDEDVLYFLVINEEDKINALYDEICKMEWICDFRLEINDSEDQPGARVLRVFHKDATHYRMQDKLMESLNVEKKVTFGCRKYNCDVVIEDASNDLMVRRLKSMFEPIHFTWGNIFLKK